MKRDAGELTNLDQCQDTVDTMWHSSSDWYVETFQYLNGNIRPHYPVPAIPLRAVWGADCMYDTVYLERPCGNDPVIVAICDMNFDRCLDFGTPWCKFYRP